MSSIGFTFMKSYGARIITPWGRMMDIPILKNILGKLELIVSQGVVNRFAGYYIVTVKKHCELKRNKSRKHQILFLSRPLIPPWAEANKNLAYSLWQNINKFHIDTVGPKGIRSNAKFTEILVKPQLWSIKVRLKILLDLLFNIRKYNIVHFFLMPRAYSKTFFKYLFGIARVKVVQNLHSEPINREKIDNIFFGDVVIVHSKYREKQLKRAGITNVRIISPGIDLDKINQRSKLLNFRNIWNIRYEKVILYAGNYSNERDIDILLETIKVIIADSMPVKFVLACRIKKEGFLYPRIKKDEFKNEAKLKRKIKELKIDKYVIFMRTVENIPAIIGASDLVIFPITERCEKADIPMVLLESMALGKPVLMSELHPYVEVLKYGGGIAISNEYMSNFSHTLKTLLLDEKLRQTIGEEGKLAVWEHFNIKNVAQSYEDLYCELLDFDL